MLRNISFACRLASDDYLRIKRRAFKAHLSMTEFVIRQCLGVPEPARVAVKFVARSRRRKAA